MDGILNGGEQPQNSNNMQVADAIADKNGIKESENNGSPYGKFKDADTLYSAYGKLEAEFTRKCQHLSELEKSISENVKTEEDISKQTPLYERENWQEYVASFITENEDAKKYSKEICEEIIQNPEDYKDEKSLEMAYAKIIKSKFIPPDKLSGDKNFLNNYILSNDEIKKQVLSIYLKQLELENVPKVITDNSNAAISFSKKMKPSSLEEAKVMVRELFNI